MMLLEDARRLEKIDELHALRLDQNVSLPMLVVVGDQSSGKSSVLEALTRLPFPRDIGLCTRFPTQIVFKRSQTEAVEVRIIPLGLPNEGQKKALADFDQTEVSSLPTFDSQAFLDLISKACRCMGVPEPGHELQIGQEAFSRDILKIEMSGPHYEHFSVVDLPGLFRTPMCGMTTKDDIIVVKDIVRGYMENRRSIILAVVPANIDLATQEIVQLADDADERKERTLGVITKPDLVDRGAEDKVLNTLNATVGLGYAIVCNRSQQEINMSSTKRDARELEFFERSPWDNIPKEKVGIGGLKKRLDALILRVSRRCFDDIGIEMGGLLSTARSDLEQLGVARETPVEQRLYLTQIASSFSALSCKAIDAHYAREACFRDTAMRLATLISTCNDKFSDMMFSEGATHLFGKSNKSEKDREQIHPSSEEESDDPGEGNSSTSASPKDAPSSKHNVHYPELASICRNLTDIPKTRRIGLMSIIARDFRDCRGMDIVSMDSAILPSLFTEQTKYWRSFALRYIISVIEHIHDFIHRMLRVVSRGAEELIGRLWSKLKVEIIGGYKSAITHVEFLVKVETTGKLMTLNHYYADNIRKAQRERMRQRLARVPSWAPGDEAPLVRVDDTINVYTSNEDHAIEIIHDSLKSYYKVARKRFVDAVINQAMGHFLLSSPVSPLWRFSPEFVSTLKDEELKDLITEPAVKQEKRKTLRAEISRLERGLSVLGQD